MKKFLALMLFAFAGLASAQSSQRVDTAVEVGGKNYAVVIPNANIYACVYNTQLACTTPIAIFADKALSVRITQPLHANGAGIYNYYVPSGTQLVEKVCGSYGQCSFTGVMVGPAGAGGGSGSVTVFQVGSWPTWLTPSVTNPNTTPTLAVTPSLVPNTALQNNQITLGTTPTALGATSMAVTGLTVNGVSPTTMSYVDATSSIQTQLNSKAGGSATFTLGATSIALGSTHTSVTGLTVDGISPTIMGFLTNITSDVQAQIDGKAPAGSYVNTINGTPGAFTFTGSGVNCVTTTCTFTGASPLTTKGDIYGFDTGNNRIPVGADNTVLTADSSQALGVKWASPVSNINGTSGAFTFVFNGGSGNCASTTCTFNGFPYPGAGIPNSTGSAWGTSYTTTGSGTVVALATSPAFTTPNIGAATASSLTDTGAAAGTGTNCLQIDTSGNITNTGAACVSASAGVTSINGTGGAFTFNFSAGAGSCSGTSCTFTGSGAGGGSVTNFTAGTLSPLFTTSVATSTTTPALTFTLSNAAANSVFAGPPSGGAAAPSFQTAPTISAANMTSFPTLNQNTTGYAAGLAAGALGSVPYQSSANNTTFLASPTTSGHTFVLSWAPSGAAVAPSALDLATYLASPPAIGGTTANSGKFTTLTATSVAGASTFCLQISSAGVISNTGQACATGSGTGTVTSFSAPSGSWPTWLVPSVSNSTTTPSLTVTAGAIPNSALQNSTFTLGSTVVTLGTTASSVAGLTIDGVSPTTMAFVDATSSIQTQLNSKASSSATLTLGATTLTLGGTTTSVTGLTVDGVSPTTMAFVDPTSSIQTQLNSKQNNLGFTPAHSGANSDITSLSGLTTPLSAGQGGTGATSFAGTFSVTAGVFGCNAATTSVLGCVKVDGSTITISSGVISASGGGGITQLTGDVLAGPGSGSQPATLATVNSSPGSCGDSTHVCQVTTNGKGLVTAQAPVAISTGGGGTITGVTAGTWLTGGGTSGTVTVNAKTQRGVDAVVDLAMDASGTIDNATKLQNYFNSLGTTGNPEIHFPCGTYYFHSTVTTNANLVTMTGDGQASNLGNGCVTISSDQAIKSIWWFDQTSSSTNVQSVVLKHLTFTDTSTNHNQVSSAVRITNQANIYLEDVSGFNLKQQIYTTGTASVTQSSKSVTGSGTTWTTSMVPGFLWVNGYPYEISSVNSTTSITLFTAYQGTTNASASYSVDFGGIFLWGDPGLGFTQKGTVIGLKSSTVSVPVYMGSGTGSTGTSRIKFVSGSVNCANLPDSIGAYFGNFSDTMRWSVSENSCAIGAMTASGHMNEFVYGDYEIAGGTYPVVTTCNGGVASQTCTKGVLVLADNSSNTWANQIVGNEIVSVGNAIEMAGISANPPTQSKVGFNMFRTNTANCVFNNATSTVGECDGTLYAAGTNATLQTNTSSNTDVAGQLTLSTGTATYNFSGTYATAPICTASDTTANASVKASATTTVLTITGTGSDVVNYVCIGRT